MPTDDVQEILVRNGIVTGDVLLLLSKSDFDVAFADVLLGTRVKLWHAIQSLKSPAGVAHTGGIAETEGEALLSTTPGPPRFRRAHCGWHVLADAATADKCVAGSRHCRGWPRRRCSEAGSSQATTARSSTGAT